LIAHHPPLKAGYLKMVCLQNGHIPLASAFSGSLIANQLNFRYSVGSPGCAPATLYKNQFGLPSPTRKIKHDVIVLYFRPSNRLV